VTFEDFEQDEDFFSEPTVGTLDDLMNEIEANWSEMAASVRGLTDEEMSRRGTAGPWSLKDVFAHIAAWEEEAARRINEIAQGNGATLTWPTRAEEDAFNAAAVEKSLSMPLDRVMKRLEECHQDLMDMLATFGEELVLADTEVKAAEWVPGWTYMHYQHHAPEIWQLKNSRTEA
jgi:hypothetical protein